MIKNYDDIINLPHHKSSKRPEMPIHDRAAQFSPFAALTGYEESIIEVGREVSKKKELTEDMKLDISDKLNMLYSNTDDKPKVHIIYFLKDSVKKGGKYLDVTGYIKKIDLYSYSITLSDKTTISIDDIYELNII